ncbi:hypothetical protein BG005_010327 [Podila minutissima]|nr:hypothetical protein BG005_010327 [Podila minutissima]
MARHSLPPIGHSIHGQSKAELMRLHQQSLERTINNTLTIIDEKHEQQKQQRQHNKKKKKYYPWLQRDSQTQREKIGLEGSRRRQRHDNGKSPPMSSSSLVVVGKVLCDVSFELELTAWI